MSDEVMDSRNDFYASGGWCAPSETIYDTGPDWNAIFDFPKVQVARGGIEYPKPAEPGTPEWHRQEADRKAREAVQAMIRRMVGDFLTAQNDAIDRACLLAMAAGWDIYIQRSYRSRFVGIMFVPGKYRLPVLHEVRDEHSWPFMDDEEDW